MMSSHGYHRSVISVLFPLYFCSAGLPSVIKLSLTSGSTTWSGFSSRTTITFAENPDFEIGLVLNSPFEFCTVYSTDNRADSLHRKLLSYRQNRNDAKTGYSSVRVAILTLVRKFKRGKHPCAYYSKSSATFHCMLEGDLVFKLNPGPTSNDDQSTISSHCSRGHCAALSSWAAVFSIAPKVNRLPFQNTSHGIPVHTTSIRRRNYYRSYMSANLNNCRSLNRLSQVPNSRFRKNFTWSLLNARSVCNKTLVIKDFVVDHAVDLLGITETWLRLKGDDVTIGELCLSGYRFVHTLRPVGTCGGVGLLYKQGFCTKTRMCQHSFRSFECTDVTFINRKSIRALVGYRLVGLVLQLACSLRGFLVCWKKLLFALRSCSSLATSTSTWTIRLTDMRHSLPVYWSRLT